MCDLLTDVYSGRRNGKKETNMAGEGERPTYVLRVIGPNTSGLVYVSIIPGGYVDRRKIYKTDNCVLWALAKSHRWLFTYCLHHGLALQLVEGDTKGCDLFIEPEEIS
jgi:hypothetical protein